MWIAVLEFLFWLSLGVLAYTYVGYPLMLSCCHFWVRKHASNLDDSYEPTVSIVLPAHNEAQYIARKLANCLSLDYPKEKIEILVGSDGSNDRTNEIVRVFQSYAIRLFEYPERRGKMATVNRLVEHATGEVCVFSDISELFDKDVVRLLVRHFADPQIGAVTGNHIYHQKDSGLGNGTSFYWRFQRFQQGIESRLSTICACDGTIYACRRELFPYPPDDTINDDVAVPLGIITQGKRVIFESQAVARGEMLTETKRFFWQKIRAQAGKYQNFVQFARMFRPWPTARFWIFLSHSVLPVLVPWFLMVLFVTNVVLGVSGPWIYRPILALHLTFYLLALIGWVAQESRTAIPLSSIPFYFVTANIGSLFGFFAYITGVQGVAWRKVE